MARTNTSSRRRSPRAQGKKGGQSADGKADASQVSSPADVATHDSDQEGEDKANQGKQTHQSDEEDHIAQGKSTHDSDQKEKRMEESVKPPAKPHAATPD